MQQSTVRRHRPYETERLRAGGAAGALVMAALTALVLVVLPATMAPAGDGGTTTLAAVGHAARAAFRLL